MTYIKINWSVRLKNKAFLLSLSGIVISFIFEILNLFEIAPIITENEVLHIFNVLLNVLSLLGVIADPTTKGLGDTNKN